MLSRIKHLKVFFLDPTKKNYFRVVFEMIHFGWVKKEIPTDYFRKYLYRKNVNNYLEYLSLNQFFKIIKSPKFVFPHISKNLEDKLSFYKICQKHNLPTPKLYSHNLNNKFYCGNNEHIITNSSELVSFFQDIFEVSNIDCLFLKPIKGIGGKGCFLLKKHQLKSQLKSIENILLTNNYIHQEYIQQHAVINKIHSKSINSIRIDTYIDQYKKNHVLSALMRFGIGNSITDNTHTGGFYISINHETGKLQGIGRKDIIEGGEFYTKHPDSKVELNNYTIPYYKEACELVKKANNIFPNRIVGWDVAITSTGPVILEGNHNPSLHVTDVAYGGYCKHPLIQEIIKELNL